MPAEAEAVIRRTAGERQAPVLSVREVFGDDVGACPETSLEGDYQRWNAATAVLTVRQLRRIFPIDDAAVAAGLRRVEWAGRWQRLSVGGRSVVLDASHNPEGAGVLDQNLRRLVAGTGRPPVIVTGVLGEYRARALLEVVCRHAAEVHLVPPRTERACTHEQMEAAAPAGRRALLRRGSLEALFPDAHTCAVGGPDDTVVVTGSIYLLGEVLARLEPARGPGEGRLQDY